MLSGEFCEKSIKAAMKKKFDKFTEPARPKYIFRST